MLFRSIYNYQQAKKVDSIYLDGVYNNKKYVGSFTSDLAFLPSKQELLILDRGNFRLVRYDLTKKKIVASIPSGRQPFGLAISPDNNTALIANVGMYSYPLVEGTTPENIQDQHIPWHPYGNNTKESKEGTVINGKKIPGLGDPNTPEAMSVYIIDLRTNQVTNKLKTGMLVGQLVEDAEVIGGASPNSIAIHEDYAYVTNATNDNIAVIDYKKGIILKHIPIRIDARIDKYRGAIPFGIDISKDGKYIWVALLGMNAVTKVNTATGNTEGLIPAGWGPTRVKLSADNNQIYISQNKLHHAT